MPSLLSTCPTRIENPWSFFLISENLFSCFSFFFFFFFQSVNKVTIAARAKTVGKIVFIDKWKYFLYYIFAYLFSVNRVTEIDSDSDEERKVPAFHSPAIIEFTSSSDTDEDTEIFASLSQRQKKVSTVLWMDEPVQTVNSIPYNIDGISVYKIKARNTVLRLEALKDGRKWNKDSTTQWTGFASVRYRVCSGGYTCPNTECLFFKQLLSLWESPIMLGKLQM